MPLGVPAAMHHWPTHHWLRCGTPFFFLCELLAKFRLQIECGSTRTLSTQTHIHIHTPDLNTRGDLKCSLSSLFSRARAVR